MQHLRAPHRTAQHSAAAHTHSLPSASCLAHPFSRVAGFSGALRGNFVQCCVFACILWRSRICPIHHIVGSVLAAMPAAAARCLVCWCSWRNCVYAFGLLVLGSFRGILHGQSVSAACPPPLSVLQMQDIDQIACQRDQLQQLSALLLPGHGEQESGGPKASAGAPAVEGGSAAEQGAEQAEVVSGAQMMVPWVPAGRLAASHPAIQPAACLSPCLTSPHNL